MTVKSVLDTSKYYAWILFHHTNNFILKYENSVFLNEGLTTQQYAVLVAMKYIKGPVTTTHLANWLGLNKNSITMIIDRMARNGWVKRMKNVQDRRIVRLAITRTGHEKLNKTIGPGRQLIERMLSSLSIEELRTFISILEKLKMKAFEELVPDGIIKKIQKNDVQDVAHFLKQMNSEFKKGKFQKTSKV